MKAFQFSILAITAMLCQSLKADQVELPVSSHNNANPFVQIHRLQGFSGINSLETGELSSQLLLQVDNEFFNKVTPNESVMLDFERTTLSLSMTYGLNQQWAVGFDIPYLFNSGGILDGLIENWHDLFGLAQGGRDNAPRDAFLISYVSEDQSLQVDERDQGIGDISILAEKSIFNSPAYQLGFRTGLKLPTGDEKHLFGSGGYALSLHLNAAARLSTKLVTFAGAGLSYLTQGDILRSGQNNLVAVATLGLAYQFKPRIMLSAQVDLNSQVYADSKLDSISGRGGALYVAAQYKFSDKTSAQFGFTEDIINKDAVPDFGIRIGYSF